jgi:hypothetical protein
MPDATHPLRLALVAPPPSIVSIVPPSALGGLARSHSR